MRRLTRRSWKATSQTAIYRLELMPSALADMKALPADVRQRIGDATGRLTEDPQPSTSKRLKGSLARFWRLRVGDYRVSYTVDHEARFVRVWRVGHRGTFYKRLQH